MEVMLVTGGSRGIGAATARLAAERGYAVCIGFLSDAAAAEDVVRSIQAAGGRAAAIRADVSVEAEVVRMFDEADRLFGPLTALVNNAGVLEAQMRLEQMTADRVMRVLATNVVGSLLCAREAIRRMSTGRGGVGGAIVNVSSTAARTGAPGEYIDYAASKGAIDSLTIGLAREIAAEGIRVNAVRPALIHTEIHARGGEPDRIDRLRGAIPLGRGGEPDEVARAILWLLSGEASFTTGSFIEVSGGL